MMKKNKTREENQMASTLANQRAVAKYQKANYDYVKIRVPKGYRDSVLRVASDAEGVSLNEYVLSTVAKRIAEEHPEIDGSEKWKISLAKQ